MYSLADQDAKLKPFQCMIKHGHISDMFRSSKIIMFQVGIHVIFIFDLFKSGGTQGQTASVFSNNCAAFFHFPYIFLNI